jgi:hypothetical protein
MQSRTSFFTAGVLALSLGGSVVRAQAPAPSEMFPFVIPWDDATAGVATDVSYLSPGGAGDDGYVVARDGHFVTERTGKRLRFLGTNFTFANDFPTHADAEKVAAHLRKMGINIVRIHHHDFDSGKLWDRRFADHRHIDADARDRLDYLIFQLKRHGIYVDLNLHVSREFTAEDGFPASVAALKDFHKRVDYFEPTMIERQREFARDYLTHVNPYTKRAYTDDPCVALIEINNENSLVSDAGSNLAGQLAELPEPFRGELATQWNQWLTAKYKTDTVLASAWSAGAGPLGANLLAAPGREWTLEHQGATAATLIAAKSEEGSPGGTINVSTIDDIPWHVQAHFAGLNLIEGATYTVTFDARTGADTPRTMTVYASLDQADWHHVGLDTNATVSRDWKIYRYTFTAQNVVAGHARLSFGLGNQTGSVEFRNVSLQPGVPPPVSDGRSLHARNLDLPLTATAPERTDWLTFLADTERRYADAMRQFLVKDLHAHAPILCSQIMWGNSAGFYREAGMDFADGHAYWDHPSFPHKPWDGSDWRISNRPMLTDLATGGGTLLGLAEYRVAGKPYTVTEYNEPAPNEYQCEAVPELAAFAAAQDWDAIFLFDWGDYGAGAGNDRIQSYFSVGSNPAKTAFLPAAALLFRAGEIRPLPRTMTLSLPVAAQLSAQSVGGFWRSGGGALTASERLGQRLSVSPTGSRLAVARATDRTDRQRAGQPATQFSADGRQAAFDSGAAGASAGYLGGTSVTVGTARLQIAPFGNNFCAVTVTPIPPRVGATASMLITLVGRVENVGMGWNAARDTVGNQWGRAPTQAEFIPATITIPAAANARVWALDATGRRAREVPATRTSEGLSFHTDPEAKTVWYEVGAARS